MKKVISIVFLSFLFITIYAQQYRICRNCNGYGTIATGYFDFYGYPILAPCSVCKGYGRVIINNNNPSFRGSYEKKATVTGYAVANGKYYRYGEIVINYTAKIPSSMNVYVKYGNSYENIGNPCYSAKPSLYEFAVWNSRGSFWIYFDL